MLQHVSDVSSEPELVNWTTVCSNEELLTGRGLQACSCYLVKNLFNRIKSRLFC